MWDNITIDPPKKLKLGYGVGQIARGMCKKPFGNYYFYPLLCSESIYSIYLTNLIPTPMLLYIIKGQAFYASSLQDALTQSLTATTVAQN